jgi:hypothetical protein
MAGYYLVRVKKDYASSVIEDLQKMGAIELLQTVDDDIPEWQKKEVLSRLQDMIEHPENTIDWATMSKKLKRLSK